MKLFVPKMQRDTLLLREETIAGCNCLTVDSSITKNREMKYRNLNEKNETNTNEVRLKNA